LPSAAVSVLGVPRALPATRPGVLAEADLSAVADVRATDGVELAARHPLVGIGTGGFRKPKADAAHDSPITVAAETGVPGLVLLVWLVLAAGVGRFPRDPRAGPSGRGRL